MENTMIRNNRMYWPSLWLATQLLWMVSGCNSAQTHGTDPGNLVPVSTPSSQVQAYQAVLASLAKDRPSTADQFLTRWQPNYLSSLPYDPKSAVNLPLIQGSHLALDQAEQDALAARGFVISGRQQFKTFFEGYSAIYADDLPLFVSADSILHAVHRSYDTILKSIETAVLETALKTMLDTMHANLAAQSNAAWPVETIADVDLYLTVARRLLGETDVTPITAATDADATTLVNLALSAGGLSDVKLFGSTRTIDFSLFAPRGHYAIWSDLESYFRASMWVSHIDMRLVEQTAAGQVGFHRREFAAALLLSQLASAASTQWSALDENLRAFIGESDNMVPNDFTKLAQTVGVAEPADLLNSSDADLAQAIVEGRFGIQRIASQIIYAGPDNPNPPLDRSFLLLGQRYIIDSEVLSNVVYDRLPLKPYRLMPSSLDVAFAVFGNSRAADLLKSDLSTYPGYPAALHDMRLLVDSHEAAFWQGSLYTGWLAAIRAASPAQDGTALAATGLPSVTGTEAWARRLLGTQLASWAELRHDTLLYTKQSTTAYPSCEFPDAYIEPAPALWAALADLGTRGVALATSLGLADVGLATVGTYFSNLATTMSMLKDMADRQQAGLAFTADQMAFINQAVQMKSMNVVCTTVQVPDGWYPQLFFQTDDAQYQDTIVADVHTQPADAAGNPVGKILHVGTSYPRLMVTTFETCNGPRAYAGVVSSYLEETTQNFNRLTDATWTSNLSTVPPVPWLDSLVAN